MVEKVEKAIKRFFWIPFICAFIGYFFMEGGEGNETLSFFEAIYASAALYFVSPVADNRNILILVAKLTAIIVTTSLILSVASTIFESLTRWLARRHKDSTAVYTDSYWGEQLAETLKHGYIGNNFNSYKVENTKDHILMFEDDIKNLTFLEEHKNALKNKRIFVALNQVDSFLLNNSMDRNSHFFNVYELIARKYWKEHTIFYEIQQNHDKAYKIAIIGYENLGKAIFKYGYLNNIYALVQNIEYHIWGCTNNDIDFLNELKPANNDKIYTYSSNYQNNYKSIIRMDRVIVTEGNLLDIVQKLILENPTLSIYCYSKEGTDISKLFSCESLHSFGDTSGILTEENIKTENLYRQAKLVNYDYYLKYILKWNDESKLPDNYEEEIENEWSKLNGFTKGSNIARADFYWIEYKNLKQGMDKEYVWEMEHIRWCRYHFFNRWEYAEKRDNISRKHHLLIPFENLSDYEKEKDGFYSILLKEKIEKLI